MNSENMIQSDGSVRIVVKHEEVSWFDFLGHSRLCRARDMGWNSRRHWVPRGVDILANNISTTVTLWTKHSFSPEAQPLPRKANFMLDRQHTAARLALSKLEAVDQASENALSFQMFEKYRDAKREERLFGKIDLVGYEIPLGRTKARQLKVDLLGVSADPTPAIEIIELKDADNTGDSPLMALTEAICYALQMLRCKTDILRELGEWRVTVNESYFAKINLRLMAPEQYWQFWFKASSPRPELEGRLKEIVDGVNAGIAFAGQTSPSSLSVSFGDI
jgi:hypothetical protein